MAKFRPVYTDFWLDANVTEEMTPEDKLFFLYLLTNPSTTQIGIYTITKKRVAFELGYSMESVKALFDRFINHHKLILYNEDTREIVIKNWGKYNLNRGGKPVMDCVKKELPEVKDSSFISIVAEQIPNESVKALFYESLHDSWTTSGQEKEEEEEKEEEQEKEITITNNHAAAPTDAIRFYLDNFGVASPYITEEILAWIEDMGEEMVLLALTKALDQSKRSWGYAKGILQNWSDKNIKTLEQVEAEEVEFKNKKANSKPYYRPPKQEIVPDWFEQQKAEKKSPADPGTEEVEVEDTKELVRNYLAQQEQTNG
ncbi:DnaD domain-containing protein [Sediminibacillus halophilus]|uniref:DnaD and phage-associated domain-containing protein n=1 Tax=Sediminibacillus halophilus TaxID=482461 RepID=A0A1G9QWX3_9BACI|nr:DnaD domain protein [Sediminibacillus halophilus]SDM15443.1 DnaD and phage-associated domain-containing protein [Sediminibacillus halophilus]